MNEDTQTAEYASPAVGEVKSRTFELRDVVNATLEKNRRNIEAQGRGNDSRSTDAKKIEIEGNKDSPETNHTLQKVSCQKYALCLWGIDILPFPKSIHAESKP
jgi:hypothetical protein